MDLPSANTLNELSPEAFAAALAPVVEGAPGFLRHLAAARPFGSDEELLTAAREVAHAMPEADRIELLNAHPRMGAAPQVGPGLGPDEQVPGGDGSPEEPAYVGEELAALNEIYESRFGFRFVVFVAGRPREEMIPLIETALHGDRDTELRRGVEEALYITADRWAHMRGASSGTVEPD